MKGNIEALAFAIIAFIVLAIPIGYTALYYSAKKTMVSTVERKECVGKEGNYLIYCNNETFENDDLLFKGKFNSSDVYNQIKEGKTYKFVVYGWRVPFFSMYRNIYQFEEIKQE